MSKKRLLAYRTYRLSKRGIGRPVGKETGHSFADSNASSNPSIPKPDFVRLHSIAIRNLGRKNHNEPVTVADGNGGTLEFKDNEIRSLEGELSNMSLQLILFLDAGLVVSKAFDELIELNKGNDNILYKLLRALNLECKEKNLPIINELFLFAQRIKSKTLMRFTSLILDNKSKGSMLSDKLDRERAQLQNNRLNSAKAKAREAETKLCFPLMLLLISLITICSAPALMQM